MARLGQSVQPGAKTRVLLVEGHVMVRQGLAHLINQERDLAICAQSSDTPAALQVLAGTRPDLVVTDITLKNGNGLEMLKIISAQSSQLPVLVLRHERR